jgi:hypothetical protein
MLCWGVKAWEEGEKGERRKVSKDRLQEPLTGRLWIEREVKKGAGWMWFGVCKRV